MNDNLDPCLLDRAILRANPAYELVLFDRLPTQEQELLHELQQDPDFYGVLKPTSGNKPARSVCQDAALLFLTLRDPAPLPAYVRARFGAASGRTVAELVLDGVLEIEEGGRFFSGPDALRVLLAGDAATSDAGHIARLSRDALQVGLALALPDARLLAMRLYGYNRAPLTPARKRLWPTPAAVERYLGCAAGGRNRAPLQQHWHSGAASASHNGWITWRARLDRPGGHAGTAAYKLYVSPAPEAVADAFDALVRESLHLPALGFKVGSDAAGLLRPDKMILYFDSFETLADSAECLGQALAAFPAQGVPFTAEVALDGLLSWGMDPPQAISTASGGGPQSWRFWVANRLARALVTAQAGPPSDVEPWRFALERLRLDGVDPNTWTPSSGVWDRYLAGEE